MPLAYQEHLLEESNKPDVIYKLHGCIAIVCAQETGAELEAGHQECRLQPPHFCIQIVQNIIYPMLPRISLEFPIYQGKYHQYLSKMMLKM